MSDGPLVPIEALAVLAEGLDHPEGVTTGPDGAVYAGGEAGQIYRVDPATRAVREIACTGGLTLGVVVDADGIVYACNPPLGGVVRVLPDGTWDLFADGSPGPRIKGPNHLAFDAHGNLYVTGSGTWRQADGLVHRIAPDGSGAVWCDRLGTCPNGICIGPDGHVYVAMTLGPGRVARAEVLPDGTCGDVADYALLERTLPDGLAFDERGDLYVVTYRPDAVYVVRRETRAVEVVASDWEGQLLASPTNVAFASIGGEPRLVVANIGRWHLSHLPVPAPGLPLHHPRLTGSSARATEGA